MNVPPWLVSASILSVSAVSLFSLYYRSLHHTRVGPRIKTVKAAGAAASTDVNGASGIYIDHQKVSGSLDRWYQSEPQGEKRHFAQVIRLRGRAPTQLELQCALTRVAAEHPRLLMLPHPDEFRIHSQLPAIAAAAGASDPSDPLPFPLPLVASWVAEPVRWAGPADSDSVRTQLRVLFEKTLNTSVSDDPPKEQCAQGFAGQTTFKPVHLQLIHSGEAVENDEFALILHVAHQIGDGIAGLLLFRHLLTAVSAARAPGAGLPPSSIPLSAFRPLSEYPSLDDLMDLRPTKYRMWQLWWMQFSGKWKKKFHISPPPQWYDGVEYPSLRLKPGEWSNCTTYLHVNAATMDSLSKHAKKHKCTVQAALHIATAFATAIASGQMDVHLLTGTSVNLRRFCQQDSLQIEGSAFPLPPPPVSLLIDNAVGITMDNIHLQAQPGCISSLFCSHYQNGWKLGRSYLSNLHSAFPFVIGTIGLLTLFNARYIVKGRAMPLRNQRSSSVTVSNLGRVGGIDANPSIPSPLSRTFLDSIGYELLDAWFGQTAIHVHALFVNSAITTPIGGLNIVLTTPTRIVTDEQIDLYTRTFYAIIHGLANGEQVNYHSLFKQMHRQ
jgi:hypothetical protein